MENSGVSVLDLKCYIKFTTPPPYITTLVILMDYITFLSVMFVSLDEVSSMGCNRYNYSEKTEGGVEHDAQSGLCKTSGRNLVKKLFMWNHKINVFPVMTSVCVTLEYHTLIYYDAYFDTKTILVSML